MFATRSLCDETSTTVPVAGHNNDMTCVAGGTFVFDVDSPLIQEFNP